MQQNYHGFAGEIGFGERPALLVIDFINGFTDETSALGSNYDDQLAATCKLLAVARKRHIPIIFTTVSYDESLQEAPVFLQKVPALQMLKANSFWTEQDARLSPQPNELIVTKKFASAFFGTALQSILTTKKIDTLIIVGCTTSGCIRATAVDAMQYGYRAIIPKQCVGDRSTIQHEANLYDLQNKYADVISSEFVLHYFESLEEGKQDVQSSY